ncbi:MAG: dihydroorotase family protein [Candidatus Hydrothermarchaeales archaeon]
MLLKNCKIITAKDIISANILIEDGKIVKIGRGLKDKEVINVKGKPVIPGLVDVHVHMRDFQQRYKEDFFSGSKAALAGGVTTFVDMPNTLPPITDERTFQRRLKEAGAKSVADFGINFGITSANLDEMEKVDPVAYKIYMDRTLGEIGDEVLEEAMSRCNGKMAFHAEEGAMIPDKLLEEFLDHARVRGPEVEEAAVRKTSELAKSMKRQVHLCHLSLGSSLEYLNEYTTCEVTPHHLFLTEACLKEMEGLAKTNPPLRSEKDVKTLLVALKEGKIDIVASDHAPHEASEKEAGPAEAPPGAPNLEVMLRLLLTLVNKRVITINRLVEVACENPAEIFGIKKGRIEVGMDADLVVLNLKARGRIEGDEFFSKAKYTPFEGWKVTGNVEKVILRGEVAYEDGDICVKRGYGEPVTKEDRIK